MDAYFYVLSGTMELEFGPVVVSDCTSAPAITPTFPTG